MFSKPTPLWIVLGGFGLACMAGGINAVGFLGMHHQAISHMSGTVTVLSNELATGRFSLAGYAVAVLLSFFLAAFLAGRSFVKVRSSSGGVTGWCWPLNRRYFSRPAKCS